MTFLESKNLITGLLFGDTKIPEDQYILPLYSQAFNYILNECTPLKLVTVSKDFSILRIETVDSVQMYVRKPRIPKSDADTLDIDDELGYAVANLVASYLSKRKPDYYKLQAIEIISQYNMKVLRAKELLDD